VTADRHPDAVRLPEAPLRCGQDAAHRQHRTPPAGPVEVPAAADGAPQPDGHHWHLSDLLHVFQRKAS